VRNTYAAHRVEDREVACEPPGRDTRDSLRVPEAHRCGRQCVRV